MDFLIAATSTYSLAWLTSDERESVKMTREALLWRLPARSGHDSIRRPSHQCAPHHS